MKNEIVKLSSVEWLMNQLTSTWYDKNSVKDIFEQAKEMHKEEIKEAFNKNINGFQRLEMLEFDEDWSEEYYNNTFK